MNAQLHMVFNDVLLIKLSIGITMKLEWRTTNQSFDLTNRSARYENL